MHLELLSCARTSVNPVNTNGDCDNFTIVVNLLIANNTILLSCSFLLNASALLSESCTVITWL
uniref:Uncharacterized protein n=1 Tax=Anguilla anguilla TaxID=7936 RepID=A0A0E9XZ08_ANGAN